MKFENLACERIDDVLKVALNRPAKLNSLSLGLLNDLRDCAEAIQRDRSIRAVLLTGEGRGFCAGADLTDPSALPAPGQSMGQLMAHRLRTAYNVVAQLWTKLPVPTVVALNGVAAGAGASLALTGDITVGARSASLTFVFAPKLGLAPDMGATYFLARRIGEARARAYALTGAPIPAEEAARIGLIAECVDDERVMERAQRTGARPGRRAARCVPRRARADGACRHQHAGRAARARGRGAGTARRQPGLPRGRSGISREAAGEVRQALSEAGAPQGRNLSARRCFTYSLVRSVTSPA